MPLEHRRLPNFKLNLLPRPKRAELPPDELDRGKVTENTNALFHHFTALLTIPGFGS